MLFLALSLALPNPALALRASGLEENSAKQEFLNQLGVSAGLEEADAIEEVLQEVARAFPQDGDVLEKLGQIRSIFSFMELRLSPAHCVLMQQFPYVHHRIQRTKRLASIHPLPSPIMTHELGLLAESSKKAREVALLSYDALNENDLRFLSTPRKRKFGDLEYRIWEFGWRLLNDLWENTEHPYHRQQIVSKIKRYAREVLPLRSNPEAFLNWLIIQDKPNDFQREARTHLASLAGVPEHNILFIQKSADLVWGLEGGLYFGVNDVFLDPSGNPINILLLRNDLENLDTLTTLVHEIAHSRQGLQATRRYSRNLLYAIIIEGYQAKQEEKLLASIARRKAPFAEQVRRLINEAAPVRNRRFPRSFVGRVRLILEHQRLLEGHGYKDETYFVESLIEKIGLDPIQALYQHGNIRSLRDALGPGRFKALRSFFQKWHDSEKLSGGPGVPSVAKAIAVAESTILNPPSYAPLSISRLLTFIDQLNDSLHAVSTKGQTLSQLLRKVEPSFRSLRAEDLLVVAVFAPNLKKPLQSAALAYMKGEIDLGELRNQLDAFVKRLTAGLEEGLRKAVDAWGDVVATPPSTDVAKRLLPIFYAPETFHAIPLVAKSGLPFLVIVTSDQEEASVKILLDQLDGVSSGQYEIRQVPDGKQAAKEAQENLTHYAPYPVDPTRPDWLQELLKQLQQEGVIPIGPYQPALHATELYFQTLA